MGDLQLSPIGLLLASAMSITNVMTDVWRKRALGKRDLFPAAFWMRVAVAAVLVAIEIFQILRGNITMIRDTGSLFGLVHLNAYVTYAIYLALDVALITIAMWLYFRALQISPLSLCVPFLAFTPVFLLVGQKFDATKLVGVVLIVSGSLPMIREKGSRYMLLVALIFSAGYQLDQKLVQMSDLYVASAANAIGLVCSFYLLSRVQKAGFGAAARGNVKWIALAGVFEAVTLHFQLASYSYLDAAVTLSIKGAGIVLSVFAGWLFFRERGVTGRVIASTVMFCGLLILYRGFVL
jgi:drug/metabolite transporter (DMT)-like permease